MPPLRQTGVSALVWLALIAAANEKTEQLHGKVIAVHDGDTLTIVGSDKIQTKIRLEGIDSPEDGQAFGKRAKEALSAKVFGRQVAITVTGQDRYGRTLGHVYADKVWINKQLVADGWAWHYTKYSKDKDLASAETAAKKARSGLWADADPASPWTYRARNRVENPTPGKVYVTKTGKKYHKANCKHLSESIIEFDIVEARKRYSPCKNCKPDS